MASKKLIFRNVRISSLNMARKKESAPFVRIHLRADLSANVRSAMGWSIGDGCPKGDFLGTINATRAVFAPNQKKLPGMEGFELDAEVNEAADFSFVNKTDKDGNARGQELVFTLRSSHPEAETSFGQFWRSILGGDSRLELHYQSIGVQSTADDGMGDDDEKGEPAEG